MASIERPKARHVSASGGFAPWPPDQGLCHLHIDLIINNTVSLFNTIYDIRAIGLLFQ